MSGRRRSVPRSAQGSSLLASALFFGALYSVAKSGHLLRTIWLCGCLLDTYRALRTVRSNGRVVGVVTRRKAIREALTSWIIYIAVGDSIPITTWLLEWIPLYIPLSTLISVAFLSTRVQSSEQIYRSFVRPSFKRYEIPVDLTILLIRSVVELVWLYMVLEPLWAFRRLSRGLIRNLRIRVGWKGSDNVPTGPLGQDGENVEEEDPPTSLTVLSLDARLDPVLPPSDTARSTSDPARIDRPNTTHTTLHTSRSHLSLPSAIETDPEQRTGSDAALPPALPEDSPVLSPHLLPKSTLRPPTSNITIRKPRTLPLDKRKAESQSGLVSKRQNAQSTGTRTTKPDPRPTRIGPSVQPSNALRGKRPLDVGATDHKPGAVRSAAPYVKPAAIHSKTRVLAGTNRTQPVSIGRINQARVVHPEKTGVVANGPSGEPLPASTISKHYPSAEPDRFLPRVSPRKRPRPPPTAGLESKRNRPISTSNQSKRTYGAIGGPESKRRRVGETLRVASVKDRPGESTAVVRRMQVYEDK